MQRSRIIPPSSPYPPNASALGMASHGASEREMERPGSLVIPACSVPPNRLYGFRRGRACPGSVIDPPAYASPHTASSCAKSTSTSRGLEPSGGPRTPAKWSWSMMRAARP